MYFPAGYFLAPGVLDAMVGNLVHGYWDAQGSSARAFDLGADRSLSVDLSGLDADSRSTARAALQSWTDATGIRFRETTGTADIVFSAAAGTSGTDSRVENGRILQSVVSIGTDVLAAEGAARGDAGFHLYLAAIGQALGLGWTSADGAAAAAPLNGNDDWHASVLSPFAPGRLDCDLDDPDQALGPQTADILAIHALYGAPEEAIRGGDDVYRHDAEIAGTGMTLEQLCRAGLYTLVDTGGTDTFDFGTVATQIKISLDAGSLGSVFGGTGNLILGPGTEIETFLAGSCNDMIAGGAADNLIDGGGGCDLLYGYDGADTLLGGSGDDTLDGGKGADLLEGGSGDDYLDGGDGDDTLLGGTGDDYLTNTGGTDWMDSGDGDDTVDLTTYGWAGELQHTTVICDLRDGSFGTETVDSVIGTSFELRVEGGADKFYGAEQIGDNLVVTFHDERGGFSELIFRSKNGVLDGKGGVTRMKMSPEDIFFTVEGDTLVFSRSGSQPVSALEPHPWFFPKIGRGYGDPADAYRNFADGMDPEASVLEAAPVMTLRLTSAPQTLVIDDSVAEIRLAGKLTDIYDDGGFAGMSLAEAVAEGWGIHVAAMADLLNGGTRKASTLNLAAEPGPHDGYAVNDLKLLLTLAAKGGGVGSETDIGLRIGRWDMAADTPWLEICVDGTRGTSVLRIEGRKAVDAHRILQNIHYSPEWGDFLDKMQKDLDALKLQIEDFAPGTAFDPFRTVIEQARETLSVSLTDGARTHVITDATNVISFRGITADVEAVDAVSSLTKDILDGNGLAVACASTGETGAARTSLTLLDPDGAISSEFAKFLAIVSAGGVTGSAGDLNLRVWERVGIDEFGVVIDGQKGSDILIFRGALAAKIRDFLSGTDGMLPDGDAAPEPVPDQDPAAPDDGTDAAAASPETMYLNYSEGSGTDPSGRVLAAREVQSLNLNTAATTVVVDETVETIRIQGSLTSTSGTGPGEFGDQGIAANIAAGWGIHVVAGADLRSEDRQKAATIAVMEDGALSAEMKLLISLAAAGGACGGQGDIGLRIGAMDLDAEPPFLEIVIDGRTESDVLRLEGAVARAAFAQLEIAGTGSDTALAELEAAMDQLSRLLEGFVPGTNADPFRIVIDRNSDVVTIGVADWARTYVIGDDATALRLSGTLGDLPADAEPGESILAGLGLHVAAQSDGEDRRGLATLSLTEDGGLAAEFKALLAIAKAGGSAGTESDLNLRLVIGEEGEGTLTIYVDGTRATDRLVFTGGLAAKALAFLASDASDWNSLFGAAAPSTPDPVPDAPEESGAFVEGAADCFVNGAGDRATDPYARTIAARETAMLTLSSNASVIVADGTTADIRLSGALTRLTDADGFAGQDALQNIAEGWGIHVAAMADLTDPERRASTTLSLRDADGGLSREFRLLLDLAEHGGAVGSAGDIGLRLGRWRSGEDPFLEIIVDGNGTSDVLRLEGDLAVAALAHVENGAETALDELMAEQAALSAQLEDYAPGTVSDPFARCTDADRAAISMSLTDSARLYVAGDRAEGLRISGTLTDLDAGGAASFLRQTVAGNIADGWAVHLALTGDGAGGRDATRIAFHDGTGGLSAEFRMLLAAAKAGGPVGSESDIGLRIGTISTDPDVLDILVDGTQGTDILRLTGRLAEEARAFLASPDAALERNFDLGELVNRGAADDIFEAAEGTQCFRFSMFDEWGGTASFGRDHVIGFGEGDLVLVELAEGCRISGASSEASDRQFYFTDEDGLVSSLRVSSDHDLTTVWEDGLFVIS